ncbi:MAG: DUF4298 domain-containing protein [Bacteroidales bacterium]|nr:DUF4298 domain-containing protein [Bacteroidales bacterium]
MERIERITRMEALFDKSEEVVKRLESALKDFAVLAPDIEELEAYYDGPDWRSDFEADEAGLLPKDLKRGVLSEDGLWNLLEDYRWLKETIKANETIGEDQ